MSLKTSLIVSLAATALVVGVQTVSAATTPDASDRTTLVQPDYGQKFLYPDGYPLSGRDASDRTTLVQPDYGQKFLYPDGYPLSARGDLGNQPASTSALDSGSGIDWPLLGIGFGV